MEVQGLAIPSFAKQSGAEASSRELRRRSRARHPHFAIARSRAFDGASTLTAMDIEGIDVAVMRESHAGVHRAPEKRELMNAAPVWCRRADGSYSEINSSGG